MATCIHDQFWWPSLDHNVKWYNRSCHICQVCNVHQFHIPPMVPKPSSLFRIVHMDTMRMLVSGGFSYIAQACCSLSAWPEYCMLCNENALGIAKFIFEDILCCHGAIEAIITNNSTPYVAALEILQHCYSINHIHISPYNSQANGVVEHWHLDIHESLIKATNGDANKWSQVAPSIFWAKQISIHPFTGFSPYYIAHSSEPTMPLDITKATYLCLPITSEVSSQDVLIY